MTLACDRPGAPRSDTTVVIAAKDEHTHRQAESVLKPASIAGIGQLVHIHDARGLDEHLDRHEAPALMLYDLALEAERAVERLDRIAEDHPHLTVVAMGETDEVATAVSCIHHGAYDYLVKPLQQVSTVLAVRRALGLQRPGQAPAGLVRPAPGADPPPLITRDPGVQAAMEYVKTVARTGKPMLITGETGTGKDLFAHAAHRFSGRRGEFVAVNVAGMDDTMISDALFGHRPGAFTGATSVRAGLVLRASAGTLFLDEIGDLSPVSQVKLLRLLQDGEYYPLGSDLPKHSTARIVAATSADLRQLIAAGRFRLDLYYRLRAHLIELSPLRERRGDIEGLVRWFAAAAARELGVEPVAIPAALWAITAAHAFRGNVRELQTLVYDAVARTPAGQPLCLDPFRAALVEERDQGGPDAGDLAFPATLPTLTDLQDALVNEALRRARGNQAQAALQIGITRQALNKRVRGVNRRPAVG